MDVLKEAKKQIDEPDAIIDLYDQTFIWVSEKFCEIVGYTKDELINKQLSDILDKAFDTRELHMHMMSSKDFLPINTSFIRKDGCELDVKAKGRAFDFQGHPYLVGKIVSIDEKIKK